MKVVLGNFPYNIINIFYAYRYFFPSAQTNQSVFDKPIYNVHWLGINPLQTRSTDKKIWKYQGCPRNQPQLEIDHKDLTTGEHLPEM